VAAIDNCTQCGKAICYRCKKMLFGAAVCGLKCGFRLMVRFAGERFGKFLRKSGRRKARRSATVRRKRLRTVLDAVLAVGLALSLFWIWRLGRKLESGEGGRGSGRIGAPPDTLVRSVESAFKPARGGMVTSNSIQITGEAEENRIVSLVADGRPVRVLLPQDGRFSFDNVKLQRGINRLEVRAISIEGDVSVLQTLVITYGPPPAEVLARDFQRGPLDRKELAFTFDGGSSENAAAAILETLKKAGIKATFFLTGEFIGKYPDTVKRIVADGHDVGNHTWNHPHLTTYEDDRRQATRPGITAVLLREELLKTAALFRSVAGRDMVPLWRAPFGEYNAEILRWAAETGFRHVGWTIGKGWAENMDTMDWVADKITEKILGYAKTGKYGANGVVILMHLGTERRDDFPHRKLGEMLDGLKRMGYLPVKVSDLMARTALAPAIASKKQEPETSAGQPPAGLR
jgi:peptidoglycan/xylan/chitin deacetylase (PgdA/CDA1 family)